MNKKAFVATALLFLIRVSYAQTQSEPVLEEVIVTAQKKQQSLQDTPIALDAFGEERLEREGISNVGDLSNNVPSLNIQPFPINATTLRIYIRGIGLIDAQITQDPPIGVYIDGAYIARSAALATDIADLERIEVLRGPQGTLYGRNSTGGAINLITKRPNADELAFKQVVTYGKRNLKVYKTSINIPLWEGAATKVSYYKRSVDGWLENTGEGGDFGDNDTTGYRLDFGWDIDETIRLDYAYDHSEVEHINLTYNHILPSEPIPNPNADQGIAFTNLINAGAREYFNFNEREERPSKLFSNIPMRTSPNEITGHQLSLAWMPNDYNEIRYITSYRELFDQTPINNIATGAKSDGYRLDTLAFQGFPVSASPGATAPCAIACVGRNTYYQDNPASLKQDQHSHELQLIGATTDDTFSYIAGLYYFEEKASTGPANVGHLLSGPLGDDPTGSRVEVLSAESFQIRNTATALYTQITWRPPMRNKPLSLTLGARYSEDTREADNFRRLLSFAVTPADGDNRDSHPNDFAVQLSDDHYDVSTKRDFTDDSFTFIAEWEISEDINTYAKYAEAYKSGGFNVREPLNTAGAARSAAGFDAENVSSTELGIKSRLLNHRIQLNATIFNMEIDGQQLNFSVPNTTSDTTVANAGTSTLKGFELDSTWLISQDVLISLNYAYLDDSIEDTLNPLSGEIEDDFVFDSAPQHAYTASVDWTMFYSPLWGRLAINATYSFTDERNGGATGQFANFSADRQDDFAVLNARLGIYETPLFGGTADVSIWGKNITDEEYSLNNIHTPPQASRSVMWSEPRSFGIDFIYNWTL